MTFLGAAEAILLEFGEPMSARDITTRAIERGLLVTRGKTPWQTMKSKLSTDILTKGERSKFMRSESGTFALREWKTNLEEFVAPRYKKALFNEDIVVFARHSLPKYIPGPGLFTEPIESDALLNELFPMRRRDAEENLDVIQLVSVFVIRYEDRYLTYMRSARLPEQRLHGEYSLAFGGHLNPDDVSPLLNIFKPELGLPLLRRELHEEVRLEKEPKITYRGLLYDDSRDLSRQHLGIVYDVRLRSPAFEIGERGFLMHPRLETKNEILNRIGDFENWSVLLIFSEQAEALQSH